jgi:tetratricopeptide (TPR) repeat protein
MELMPRNKARPAARVSKPAVESPFSLGFRRARALEPTFWTSWTPLLLCFALLVGCADQPKETAQQRYDAAQSLFEQTAKGYHLRSAEAHGAARDQLLAKAAEGYTELLRKYADQPFWAVQALRSLGNVRATQGRIDDAIKAYFDVERKYPRQDWQVLQAWKSAADLLWENGRREEAQTFYKRIVVRFDQPMAQDIVQLIVRGSQLRLAGQ